MKKFFLPLFLGLFSVCLGKYIAGKYTGPVCFVKMAQKVYRNVYEYLNIID